MLPAPHYKGNIAAWSARAMPKPPFADLLLYIRTLCGEPRRADLTDSQLLDRFLTHREETAFALLVQRYGPLVLGVCRRVLRDAHAAEDVFQATFLVLARRAASIRKRANIGTWLHGVAQRVALRARAQRMAQRELERQASAMTPSEPIDERTWGDLRAVLDEEVAALPAKYASAIILCYLQDKSYDQAAKELRCSKTTVARRVALARGLLHDRLVRRGITLSAGAVAAALCSKANGAPVGALLTIETVKAALCFTAEKAATTGVSATVLSLAEYAMGATAGIRAKVMIAALLCALVLGGAGWAARGKLTEWASDMPHSPQVESGGDRGQPPAMKRPAAGEPLPTGAVTRLGSAAFRHGSSVYDVAYTPDGKSLVSAASAGSVCLWDSATGKLLWRVSDDHLGSNPRISMSADGKTLAIATLNNFSLLETATGKVLIRQPWANVSEKRFRPSMAIAPDLGTVAFGLDKARATLFDTATGNEKISFLALSAKPIRGDLGYKNTLAFSADSKTIFGGIYAGPVVAGAFDAATGKFLRALEFDIQPELLVVSPNGRLLAGINLRYVSRIMGDTSKIEPALITILDLQTGKRVHQLTFETRAAYNACAAFSNDGSLFAISHLETTLLFDLTTGKMLRQFPSSSFVFSLAFSPDDTVLAAGTSDPCLTLWDVATGKPTAPSTGAGGHMSGLRFAADGKQLLNIADGVEWWDVAGSQRARRLPRNEDWKFGNRNWSGSWGALPALTADGKLLATPGPDRTVLLIDTQDGKVVRSFSGLESYVWAVALSLDGTLLIASSLHDPRAIVWNVATGARIRELKGYADQLEISPDGRWLATTAGVPSNPERDLTGPTFRLWDTHTGKLLPSAGPKENQQQQGQYFSFLTFTPDSSLLLTSARNVTRMWEVPSCKEVPLPAELAAHECRAAFSPDGRMLVTSDMRLWDVASWSERRRFVGHAYPPHSLEFSPDGRLLAAASDDAPVFLWDVYSQQAGGPAKKLSMEERAKLWRQLASEDAKDAFTAICALIAHGDESVPLLQENWKQSIGAGAKLKTDTLRQLRMLEVLEQLASGPARQFLKELTEQTGDSQLAQAAAQSLRRLEARVK
jgi:RNA polymerase sigma factor (sigma-70 family)